MIRGFFSDHGILLSERLKEAVSLITTGNITADIGCDHAYSSIYLIENNISPFVYASDVNDGPIKIAKKNIESVQLEDRIILIKSDGLEGIKEEYNIQSLLICGIGGNLMIEILDNDLVKEHFFEELILQPQSDIHKVRHFLHDNGYRIEEEKMLSEDGHYYTIIKTVCGNESYPHEYQYIYGEYLIRNHDSILLRYLYDQLEKKHLIISSLKSADYHTDNITDRIKTLETECDMINVVLKEMSM